METKEAGISEMYGTGSGPLDPPSCAVHSANGHAKRQNAPRVQNVGKNALKNFMIVRFFRKWDRSSAGSCATDFQYMKKPAPRQERKTRHTETFRTSFFKILRLIHHHRIRPAFGKPCILFRIQRRLKFPNRPGKENTQPTADQSAIGVLGSDRMEFGIR